MCLEAVSRTGLSGKSLSSHPACITVSCCVSLCLTMYVCLFQPVCLSFCDSACLSCLLYSTVRVPVGLHTGLSQSLLFL